MATFQKLAEKIERDHGYKLYNFRRVHAGYWQRAQGAWSWSAEVEGYPGGAGSQWSAGDILKAKKLSVYKSYSGIDFIVEK